MGNRVSCYDLNNSKSFTFSYEHRKNIARIALNPQATLLISVDVDGRAILVNFISRTVLYYFNFKEVVHDLKFSPDGKYFAVAAGRQVQVWKTPESKDEKQFAPFVRHRIYAGHFADVTSITWSDDSRFFLASSKDLTTKVFSLRSVDSVASATLSGHRESVIASFFSEDQETIYTVAKDGALFQWKYLKDSDFQTEDEEDEQMDSEDDSETGRWRVVEKNFFQQDGKVKCCTFHASSNLLVVGFSNGIFGLYELPEFTTIQTLSISQNEIDNVAINKTGEWLAFGASKLGQLLVWEWQSESYVIKQQGHFDSLNAVVYSPDGSKIVTASDDGKIKVWDAYSGFSIVTFTEHTSGVTALQFSKRGNVLFSASLDGSVRAWDLIRYRNFRTFTAPTRVQFSSLAVDPSGEVICAGSLEEFDIHVWSVQTAQLLDRLQGHEGPISCLSFGSEGGLLASASWDKTVRIWSIFGRGTHVEPLQMRSDVLAIAMRPDSKQVAVSSLDGLITFWDIGDAKEQAQVDGREDLAGGRHTTDRFTAKNSNRSKYFTTLCYSADGSVILGGGNSKYICLYDIDNQVLLRKYTISKNMNIEGTLDYLNSKNMTEAGPLALIDTTGEASDVEDRIDNSLPGTSRGDVGTRKIRPQIRTASIQFSPTGQSFTAASTEGLLIYSQDDQLLFDPLDLDIDVTIISTLEKLENKQYLTALIMAFRLSEKSLIQQVYESIPLGDIELISNELPPVYLERFFKFLASILDDSPHIEFHLLWIQSLITAHGQFMLQRRHEFASVVRPLAKFVTKVNKDINRLANNNIYYIQFLLGKNSKIEAVNGLDMMDGIELIKLQNEDVEMNETGSEEEDDDDEEGWYGPESKNAVISKSSNSGSDDNASDSDEE